MESDFFIELLEAEWEKRKQIVRDTGKIKTNDLLVNATLTLVKTNHTINEELGKMVTKEQIAGMQEHMATKEQIVGMQGQMLQMATKEQIAGMQGQMLQMATKEQIAGMQGQMLQMATKESLNKSLYAMGITIITIMTFVIAVLKFLI